jgi:rare lipoprotein A (peptidoglycan hydrolase)
MPRIRTIVTVALAVMLLTGGTAAAHRDLLGWWKYDPAFWRHDFREHQELRQDHRRWHDGHRRPRHAGPRQERWTRRHTRMHHLRLDHPHQALHFHDATARQAGQASWYDLEGATGSCQEPLHGLYAAHPTWPCGTLVSVRTADRYVFVRVLDRGPSADGRVIDLAKRAFERLASPSKGLVDVKVYRLEP